MFSLSQTARDYHTLIQFSLSVFILTLAYQFADLKTLIFIFTCLILAWGLHFTAWAIDQANNAH